MRWKEILMFWFAGQVGNFASILFGTTVNTVMANLYFTSLFAFFLAVVAFFKKDGK